MTKIISTDKARGGKPGLPVLKVLIAALILAVVVWGGLEIWGRNIAPSDNPAAGVNTTNTTP